MSDLYPEIEAYNSFNLKVSDIHTLYVEESGSEQGIAVIVLHGGPGGGSQPSYRRYFNPEKYRIIQFDQRGCGKSTPFSELKENTTWDLVEDIQKIKNHLEINSWIVFGGSWGSTLALAYAETYPLNTQALILRGIFLLRDKEIKWFYQEGASKLFPDAFEKYIAPIPEGERNDLVSAFYKRLTSDDQNIRNEAAKAWAIWEASTSKLIQNQEVIEKYGADEFADAFARIECHYFTNKGFFENENYLLDNAHKLDNIPVHITHGRYDVVCPVENAWELSKVLKDVKLSIIPDAGHSLSEGPIISEVIKQTDAWAQNKNFI